MSQPSDEPAMDFGRARQAMVEQQLQTKDIHDLRVLDAMARVPREVFVLAQDRQAAYEDRALPIDLRQTISQPYMVALMSQWLQVGSAAYGTGDRHGVRLPDSGLGDAGQTRILLGEAAGFVAPGPAEAPAGRSF